MSIGFAQSTYRSSLFVGLHFVGALSYVENRFKILPQDEWSAFVDANHWINDGGMAPTAVLCTTGFAAFMLMGAAASAINHVARSTFNSGQL